VSTRSDQFALAADGSFQQRVLAAAMKYCITTVLTEAPATGSHADRVALTYQVFLYPSSWNERLSITCVMQSTALQNAAPADKTATDADIDTAIAAVWTGLSLANTAAQADTWKVT
jgi:hypothetical protein